MKSASKLSFVGDSLIEYYDWQARFPGASVLNLGVAGETAHELLARISSFGGKSFHADGVILMTGTNDLLMGEDFLPIYAKIIGRLQKALPGAVILANGIMPMALPWLAPNLIAQTNARLEELALRHKIGYLDGCRLLSSSAANRPCFLDDGVHLSPQGYALWSAAIENHLRISGCI